MSRRAVVLGTDHYNTIGVVQSLGREGVLVDAVIVGSSKLISSSVFVSSLHVADSFESAIEWILSTFGNSTMRTAIIPCGDAAALNLERNRDRLERFLFQKVRGNVPLSELMDKHRQAEIAEECGMKVPITVEISSAEDSRLSDMVFPCIVKPAKSCEGDKTDIAVFRDSNSLRQALPRLISRASSLVVQQFIGDKKKELNILGCRFSNGRCLIPIGIEKIRVYPEGTGSVSVCETYPFSASDEDMIRKIEQYMERVDYVGLFSFEFILEKETGNLYFIELNFRNDALSRFIDKSGVNLPFFHFLDLCGETFTIPSMEPKRRKMICEPIHLSSLYHKDLSFWKWFTDLFGATFLLSDRKDWGLFFNQFVIRIMNQRMKHGIN